ncbi:MAG: DNA replication/repair protein RecF [Gammaproteobacteria bacterium]|nr:DNA replication/repair protein RecF [Gammaproteobacteria bacterium]
MSLASLQVSGVRSIGAASLELRPGLNLIFGPNGSGKTSILESAFLVGRGRSFRTRHTEQLISRGVDRLQLFATTTDPAHRIGFEYRRDESYVGRLDGQDIRSLAELPGAFFVEVIDPEVHRLVEGAPGERRRWLDWGVFHVEPSFLDSWLRFSRTLKQRNAALRQGMDPSIWDAELVTHGERVASARGEWLKSVQPFWKQAVLQLSGLEVDMSYYQGWAADRALAEVLADGRDRDRTRGSTLSGPQRADVKLTVQGRPAREVLSRGQQKLVAAALVLALLQRLRGERNTPPTLLLDDPAAELDTQRLGALVDLVKALDCQLIVTSLHADLANFGLPERVFHVERGVISSLG